MYSLQLRLEPPDQVRPIIAAPQWARLKKGFERIPDAVSAAVGASAGIEKTIEWRVVKDWDDGEVVAQFATRNGDLAHETSAS